MNKSGSTIIDVIIGINMLIILAILSFRMIFINQRILYAVETLDKFKNIAEYESSRFLRKNDLLGEENIWGSEFKFSSSKKYFGNECGVNFYIVEVNIENEKNKIEKTYKFIVRE